MGRRVQMRSNPATLGTKASRRAAPKGKHHEAAGKERRRLPADDLRGVDRGLTNDEILQRRQARDARLREVDAARARRRYHAEAAASAAAAPAAALRQGAAPAAPPGALATRVLAARARLVFAGFVLIAAVVGVVVAVAVRFTRATTAEAARAAAAAAPPAAAGLRRSLAILWQPMAVFVGLYVAILGIERAAKFAAANRVRRKYRGAAEQTQCCVCLEDFCGADDDDDASAEAPHRVLWCGHKFHQECLEPWLKRQMVCPLCRSPCA
ncbi:hypothetical protein M885DRAFT_234954 [Pelagophyceae sp. CCMP2097]|nr:hypothetical protein M885DRAFT_234954 [Pelagophyceae sp. CCMP2097]